MKAVVVAALLATGCTHAPSPAAAVRHGFGSEDQKLSACLDLRDHIVDLYATSYLAREGLEMSDEQLRLFRDGWAEELAKRGTFDRFEQTCFESLTPGKYECGMAATTTDGLVACMKIVR